MFGLKPVAAEMPGKIATFAFYVIMCVILAFGPDVGILGDVFVLPAVPMLILVSISLVLTLVAFFSYVPGVISQVKEKKASK
jgi:hypothetical protein